MQGLCKVLQLMNFWCKTEQAACGSVLQTVVFAVKTLQEVHLAHEFHALEIHFWHCSHHNQSFRVWCGWSFNQ